MKALLTLYLGIDERCIWRVALAALNVGNEIGAQFPEDLAAQYAASMALFLSHESSRASSRLWSGFDRMASVLGPVIDPM